MDRSEVISLFSLVISVLTLGGMWFQREANKIALQTFERENFPHVTVQWGRTVDINFDPPQETFFATAINEGKLPVELTGVGIGAEKRTRSFRLHPDTERQEFRLSMLDPTAPEPEATFPYPLQPGHRLTVSTGLAGVVAMLNRNDQLLGKWCNVHFVSETDKYYESKRLKTSAFLALLRDADLWARQTRARPYLEKTLGLTLPEAWKTPKTPPE